MELPAIVCLCFILFHAWTVKSGKSSRPKLLLLGDSITAHAVEPVAPWSAMLTVRFHREVDIVNRGANGYTTRGYKLIFNEAVQGLDPQSVAAVVIFLGANDADPENHVPLDYYRSNLKDLVKYLTNFGVSNDKVILLPPPPYYKCKNTKWKARAPEITQSYAEAASEMAKTSGLTTVDIHTIFQKDPRAGKLFSDGLHFTFDGAKLFYEAILPVVEEKLKRYENRTVLLHHFGPYS